MIPPAIDPLHLQDLRNATHPSLFDVNDGYNLFIFRLPLPEAPLVIHSVGFVMTPVRSFYYDRERDAFGEPLSRFDGPLTVVNAMTDGLLAAFTRRQERISDMEEAMYDDNVAPEFMTQWLKDKRDLVRMERVLQRTEETLSTLIDHYESDETFPVNAYENVREHLGWMLRSASLQLTKLDYLYNFYTVRTNEKLNRMLSILTLISVIFLPMNLVVGFFGMNTGGLPLAGAQNGTLAAALIVFSASILFSLVIYFLMVHRSRR